MVKNQETRNWGDKNSTKDRTSAPRCQLRDLIWWRRNQNLWPQHTPRGLIPEAEETGYTACRILGLSRYSCSCLYQSQEAYAVRPRSTKDLLDSAAR